MNAMVLGFISRAVRCVDWALRSDELTEAARTELELARQHLVRARDALAR